MLLRFCLMIWKWLGPLFYFGEGLRIRMKILECSRLLTPDIMKEEDQKVDLMMEKGNRLYATSVAI